MHADWQLCHAVLPGLRVLCVRLLHYARSAARHSRLWVQTVLSRFLGWYFRVFCVQLQLDSAKQHRPIMLGMLSQRASAELPRSVTCLALCGCGSESKAVDCSPAVLLVVTRVIAVFVAGFTVSWFWTACYTASHVHSVQDE